MTTPAFTKERSSSLQYVGVPNTANNTSTASLTAEENGVTHERQTRLDFTLVSISTADAATNGAYGSLKIYTFPAGTYGIIRNVVVNLTAVPGAGGITDTATLKYSIGTAAEATNDTLDSTQANILASTNATAFVGGLGGGGAGGGALTGVTNTAVAVDSRSAAVEAFLNLGIADAGHGATADTVTLSGSIWITWALLGT
jgi:galactokinase